MIKVTDNNNNIIYYKCDCGTKGMCTVKPMDKNAALVVEISCPNCEANERMVLMQRSSDVAISEVDFSWGMTLDNKELEEEE